MIQSEAETVNVKEGGGGMTKEERVKQITDGLYEAYGSDSGHLFGLKPKQREVVQVIVKYTLEFNEGE